MDLTAFVDGFRAEASDHLRAMDTQLLQLERDPSVPEPIRQMFIAAHTIKGGAAMLGLEEVRDLAHALEDVLGCLRDRGQPLDSPTADLLFRALDELRELLEGSGPGGTPGPAVELVAALRRRATDAGDVQATGGAAEPSLPPVPRVLLVEDSPTVRLLEEMLLSEAGFEVDAVGDGQEALGRALARSYQLVVAGTETSGLRGLELAAALRGSPAHRSLPFLLTCLHEDAEQRRRAEEIGVQVLLQKGSLSRNPLAEAAREALAWRPA